MGKGKRILAAWVLVLAVLGVVAGASWQHAAAPEAWKGTASAQLNQSPQSRCILIYTTCFGKP
jgi:hypothetical protein